MRDEKRDRMIYSKILPEIESVSFVFSNSKGLVTRQRQEKSDRWSGTRGCNNTKQKYELARRKLDRWLHRNGRKSGLVSEKNRLALVKPYKIGLNKALARGQLQRIRTGQNS